jgi:RNA polymerase sigma-70 factor (ECF subfamily)
MLLQIGGAVTEPAPIPAQTRRAALDARFMTMRPKLLAMARGLVGSDAAEDVVQDAYLRAAAKVGQLRDPGAMDGWLTRIVISTGYNHHRRRLGLLDRLPLLARRNPMPQGPDAGLRELVERLPPRERTVLVLHYAYGYGLEEIGQIVGVSHINARTIIHRARRRLAEAWERAEQ